MNTILEDRLRAHFAEQAALDVLEDPDPRAVIDRAHAVPAPLPLPRRRPPARGSARGLIVIAGLAAACLLAVVAIVATRGGGDKVGTSDDPDPTTTDQPERRPTTTAPDATSTTVPETTTTAPGGAAASVRSVVVAPLGVLGWWDGEHWVNGPQHLPAPLQGGEQYQLTRIGTPTTTVTGPAPTTVDCIGEDDRPMVRLDGFAGDGPVDTVVGVTGVADIQPRPVTVLDPAGYKDEAVAALASAGIDDPAARPKLVVRADLDGDGSDEVLMQVERVADRGSLIADPGDYSAVFIRELIGGEVKSTVVEHYVAEAEYNGYILVFSIVAVADLNGDGRMEVVLDHNYYEGSSTVAYELAGNGSLVDVMGTGCGV
ncbi:MAG TPA: hypothetical protein VH479_19640 [Acidimicrobiales bacterium]|jgi:hypothetical protein